MVDMCVVVVEGVTVVEVVVVAAGVTVVSVVFFPPVAFPTQTGLALERPFPVLCLLK